MLAGQAGQQSRFSSARSWSQVFEKMKVGWSNQRLSTGRVQELCAAGIVTRNRSSTVALGARSVADSLDFRDTLSVLCRRQSDCCLKHSAKNFRFLRLFSLWVGQEPEHEFQRFNASTGSHCKPFRRLHRLLVSVRGGPLDQPWRPQTHWSPQLSNGLE